MPVNKSESTTYSVPALDKGLDLLEALSVSPVPLTLTDLARALNRSPSVLFRVVTALEKRRYIARDIVSEGYRLTLKLFELAHTHSPLDQLLRAAIIPMRQLSDTVRESVHLAILEQANIVNVAEELSPERVRLSVEVGYKADPVRTVSGRLLLSFLRREEQLAVLAKSPAYQQMNRARQSQLQEKLTSFRKTGYVFMESSERNGLDLAVMVGNPDCGVIASLAVTFLEGGPNDRQERKILPIAQEYANRITNAIGITPLAIEKAGTRGTPQIKARNIRAKLNQLNAPSSHIGD